MFVLQELARTRKAEMVTFMSELHTRAFKTATAQEHLRDHDVAMANAGQTVTDAEGGWFKVGANAPKYREENVGLSPKWLMEAVVFPLV